MIYTPELFQYYLYIQLSISIFILFSINFIINKEIKFILSLLVVSLLSIMFGIRGEDVGLDTLNYSKFLNAEVERYDIEPMFQLLRYFNSLLYLNANISFLIISLVTNILFLLTFKKISSNYPILMAIFISTFIFLLLNISMIRQGLAMSFFAFALTSLIYNKTKQYFIFSFLAIISHYSAGMILLFYLLNKIDVDNKKNIYLILLITTFLYFFNIKEIMYILKDFHWFFNKIYWYLSWEKEAWKLKHIYYLFLLLMGVYIYLYNKINILNKKMVFFSLVGFMFVIIFRLDEMTADRLFYYYMFLHIVLIYQLKSIIKNKYHYLVFLFLGIFIWLNKSILLQYFIWFIPPYLEF